MNQSNRVKCCTHSTAAYTTAPSTASTPTVCNTRWSNTSATWTAAPMLENIATWALCLLWFLCLPAYCNPSSSPTLSNARSHELRLHTFTRSGFRAQGFCSEQTFDSLLTTELITQSSWGRYLKSQENFSLGKETARYRSCIAQELVWNDGQHPEKCRPSCVGKSRCEDDQEQSTSLNRLHMHTVLDFPHKIVWIAQTVSVIYS